MDRKNVSTLFDDVRYIAIAETVNLIANFDQLDHTPDEKNLLVCIANYNLLWERTNKILEQQEEILKLLRGLSK